MESLIRYIKWGWTEDCKGFWRNYICILSIGDLPELIRQPHFFINKLFIDFDPITYQCLEEWYMDRMKSRPYLNMDFYCDIIMKRSSLANCYIPKKI